MKKILLMMCSILCLSVGSIKAYTHTYTNKTNVPIWLWIGYAVCNGDHVRIEPGKSADVNAKLCCLEHIDLTLDNDRTYRLLFKRDLGFMYCSNLRIDVTGLDRCEVGGDRIFDLYVNGKLEKSYKRTK